MDTKYSENKLREIWVGEYPTFAGKRAFSRDLYLTREDVEKFEGNYPHFLRAIKFKEDENN